LKSYQLAFLLAAGTTLLTFFPTLGKFNKIQNEVFWPVEYVLSFLPRRWEVFPFGFLLSLLLGLTYLFFLWLLIVRGFRRSSRGFKLALALCVLASFLGSWGLKAHHERIDWTSHGLNPDRPGFKPAVVLLAGTFEFGFTSADAGAPGNAHPPPETARFEIRMRGADYYYAERWVWHPGVYPSWDSLMLSLPHFSGTWDRSRTGSGVRGQGGGNEVSEQSLQVARRLWRGDEFIGAATADEISLEGATERFSDLKQFGSFKIPCVIEFTDADRHEILHVRRVEFLNQPDTNWFLLIRQKYFGNSEDSKRLWMTNLHEAGWTGEQMQ
jgi:hypothetical protein